MIDLLADLEARGLIHDSTDRDALAARLARGPITVYHGIDPSADSLHTGNLIGLMMLRRFQLAGHRPIALAGGATGMIGDPGGRSEERNLLDEDILRANVAAIKSQMSRVLGEAGEWQLVDNYEWTRDIPLLAFLRDVGKHVTVNQMMARESVRTRLQSEHGISYTEFSYMLLQANDYWWLHEHQGCELQIGGSDQWGNILSGVDLIRRRSGASVHALCWPLLTASDGTKLGKTTGARVWLDPAKTSPYELYQHFVQTGDREVRQLLLWLTLLPVDDIAAVVQRHEEAPQHREAQRLLAREVVTLVHGAAAAQEAENGTTAWSADLSPELLRSLEASLPTTELRTEALPVGLVDLLVRTELAASKSAATRLVRQGGAYANDVKIDDEERMFDAGDFLEGRWLLLRAGKRRQHLVVRALSG
ncbi:MAG: tyrosyl-tRNA synthetase [Acidimicrobiaceae bacterium]